MTVKALIFGSIGTLVETSELQRRAFEQAFADHELDWRWEPSTYIGLLQIPGGRNRIRHWAEVTGQAIDEDTVRSIHAAKTRAFNALLAAHPQPLRPGVARLIHSARAAGWQVAIATTTQPQTLETLRVGALAALGADQPEIVLSGDDVASPKPAPDIYNACLQRLGISAREAVAIEDTEDSLAAAVDAGVPCVVTPGDYAPGQVYPGAAAVVAQLGDRNVPARAWRTQVPLDREYVTLDWLARVARHRLGLTREAFVPAVTA